MLYRFFKRTSIILQVLIFPFQNLDPVRTNFSHPVCPRRNKDNEGREYLIFEQDGLPWHCPGRGGRPSTAVKGLATLFSILPTTNTTRSFLPTILPGHTHTIVFFLTSLTTQFSQCLSTFLPSPHLDKLGGEKKEQYKCAERAMWGERSKKKDNSVSTPGKHSGEKGSSSN